MSKQDTSLLSSVKAGRNDPCPCGSGQKYKKCCGRVMPIQPIAPAAAAAGTRVCGTCTACCDGWAAANIYGHEVAPGKPCPFVQAHRCSIYERRPMNPCQKFECAWLAKDSPFPEHFRPDKLGIILIRVKWRGHLAYVMLSAGRDPDEELLAWMRKFSERTGRPFFYEQQGKKFGFGPPEFQQDMIDKASRGEPMW